MYKPLNNNNNPSTHNPNQSQSQSQSQSHYQFMDLIHGLVFTKNDINITRTKQKISSFEYSKLHRLYQVINSSFIPQDNQDLLQIEYRFDKTAKSKPIPIFYTINIILFILFYILLFSNSTTQVARYLLLIISLSLTLTCTRKPSYIQIIKYKFPLDQSTVPYNAMVGIGDIKPWAALGVLFGVCYLCITLDLTDVQLQIQVILIDCTPFIFMVLFAPNIPPFADDRHTHNDNKTNADSVQTTTPNTNNVIMIIQNMYSFKLD